MFIYNTKFFRKIFFCILITFFFFFTSPLKSQEKNNDESLNKIINYIELIYGTDDALVNGQPYFIKNKDVKGHPFFKNEIWSKETLVIKGKIFYNVELNYDVEDDKLILNAKFNKNLFIKIELSYEAIDSFNIQGHHFINSSQLKNYKGSDEYFEKIYNGNFYFLIKHKKTIDKTYYDNPPYGKYNNLISVYYIYKEGIIEKLRTKKSFLNYFKENKKEIRMFMRKNKIKYKKASPEQLLILMKFCDNLLNK